METVNQDGSTLTPAKEQRDNWISRHLGTIVAIVLITIAYVVGILTWHDVKDRELNAKIEAHAVELARRVESERVTRSEALAKEKDDRIWAQNNFNLEICTKIGEKANKSDVYAMETKYLDLRQEVKNLNDSKISSKEIRPAGKRHF
jgi:hypothetical protein